MREGAGRRNDPGWSRRDLGRVVVGAAGIVALGLDGGMAEADEVRDDSILDRFDRSLTDDQRREIVFPWDDPRRVMVQNHWAIVPSTIANLTADQQVMALDLVRQVCTPEGFASLTRQRDEDAGGWKHDHLVVFGSPADPRHFEWVLTGRHLTLRGSSSGAITGGPLFLGHSDPGPATIGRDQAERVATLFHSLEADSRRRVMLGPGLILADLGPDQQINAGHLLASLAEPFRRFEVPAVRACLTDRRRLGAVRWQGFRAESLPGATPPTVWRLVGPGFTWSFHAEPHVHSWFDSV